MGVSSFYRWLANKYLKIVVNVVEKTEEKGGTLPKIILMLPFKMKLNTLGELNRKALSFPQRLNLPLSLSN